MIGLTQQIELIEALEGIDAIFITKNKDVYATSGIKEEFKTTNDEFTYKNNILR